MFGNKAVWLKLAFVCTDMKTDLPYDKKTWNVLSSDKLWDFSCT